MACINIFPNAHNYKIGFKIQNITVNIITPIYTPPYLRKATREIFDLSKKVLKEEAIKISLITWTASSTYQCPTRFFFHLQISYENFRRHQDLSFTLAIIRWYKTFFSEINRDFEENIYVWCVWNLFPATPSLSWRLSVMRKVRW